jgi:hypothetical protein
VVVGNFGNTIVVVVLLYQCHLLEVVTSLLHSNVTVAISQGDGSAGYVGRIIEGVEGWCYRVGGFLKDLIPWGKREKEGISGSKKLCPHCDGRGWVLPKRCRELDDNMSDFSY